LATHLRGDETIQLQDGRVMAQVDLYLEALKADPNHANVYLNLGFITKNGTTVTLPDGRVMGQRGTFYIVFLVFTFTDLYIEAIKHDPKLSSAYSNLAISLKAPETITLNGRQLGPKDLFQEALKLHPRDALTYSNLGACLRSNEPIQLGSKLMTPKDLFLEAITIDPRFALGYYNLASLLRTNTEAMIMPDGGQMDRKALYLETLRLDPEETRTYRVLAGLMNPTETLELPDGRVVTKDILASM
jgi:tetratricopeptide (TPR) repeat protein